MVRVALYDRETRAAHLVYEVLAVVVAEFLCPDDTMQIGLHQLLHKIHLVEIINTWGIKDVKYGNDVFVAKVAQKLDLAKSSQTEHGVLKGRDALDCNFTLSWQVYC
jgi:hypothetical protein